MKSKRILMIVLTLVMVLSVVLFTACGEEPTVTSVTVTAPSKTAYVVGESIDLAGAKVTVTMSDGTEQVVELGATLPEGFTASSLLCDNAGPKVVTITYSGKQATFRVSVEEQHTHAYGTFSSWKNDVKPSEAAGATAIMACKCGSTEEVTVPALSDTSVWRAKTTPANHYIAGKTVYTSDIYGKVVVEIPMIAHEYSISYWKNGVKPSATAGATAVMACECGATKEVTVPALSDTTVWKSETISATHTKAGKTVYTSATYGSVEVAIPMVAHNYNTFSSWKLGVQPTEKMGSTAIMACECGATKEVIVPALTNTTVWTAVTEPATHFATGKTGYTSAIYGSIEVVIPVIPHTFNTFDSWKNDTEPSLTAGATAVMACECGTKTEIEVPALSDTKVWSIKETVAPDYNKAGTVTYTSVYGDVTIAGEAKLAAAYDSKAYQGILCYSNNDTIVNGGKAYVMKVGTDSKATDTFHKTSYTNPTVSFELVDGSKAYGEIKVTFAWETTSGEETVVNTETHKGFVTEDGYIAFERNGGFDSLFFFVPTTEELTNANFKTCYAINNCKMLAYVNNETRYNLFVNDTVNFNVQFVDVAGKAINAESITKRSGDEVIPNVPYVKVISADNKEIVAWANTDNTFIATDGKEGVYTCEGETLTVWGNGTLDASEGNLTGVYTISDSKLCAKMYDGETMVAYWVITLGAENTFTKQVPTYNLVFNVGEHGEAISSKSVNIIVPSEIAAPTAKAGSEGCKFLGWFLDDKFTTPIGTEIIIPEADVTIYALWRDKITVTIIGAKTGDATSVQVGPGDVLVEKLPQYTAETFSDDGTKLFRGWFVGEVGSEMLVDETFIISMEDESGEVWVKWVDVVTVTIDYEGATTNAEIKIAAGDEFDAAPYVVKVDGYAHTGFFSDNAYETEYVAGVINENTTIYAHMQVSATPFYGETGGLYIGQAYSTSNGYVNSAYYNRKINVDLNGVVTGDNSGTIVFTSDDKSTFTLGEYFGCYNDEFGLISIWKSGSWPVIYAYGASNLNVVKSGSDYQGSGCCTIYNGKTSYSGAAMAKLTITRGQETSEVVVFFFNGQMYCDVNFGATDYTTNLRKLNSLVPTELNVYSNDETPVLLLTLKKSGSTLVLPDGLDGKYTGANGDLTLDGVGKLTVGTSSTTYSYTIVEENVIEYADSKMRYLATLNVAEKTYTAVEQTVTLIFSMEGHGEQIASIQIPKGLDFKLSPLPAPTCEGYAFSGWFKTRTENTTTGAVSYSSQIYTSTAINSTTDITIYAKWLKICTVSFTTEHGVAPTPVQKNQGVWYSVPSKLADTDGYRCTGWAKPDGTATNGFYVEDDITLSAIWKPLYTITFTTEFGTAPASIIIMEGESLTTSTLAGKKVTGEREGYLFDGWKVVGEEEKITSNITVTGDMTLVSVWTEPVTFTVVYGNTLEDKVVSLLPGTTVNASDYMKKEVTNNLVMDGLYSDPEFKTAFTSAAINANTTVYAKWIAPSAFMGSYQRYELDNGTFRTYATATTVDAFGVAKESSSTYTIADYNATTGTFIYKSSSSNYNGHFDATNKVFARAYGPSATGLGTDTYVFIPYTTSATTISGAYLYSSDKTTRLAGFTVDGSTFIVLIHENKVYGNVIVEIGGVPATDFTKIKAASSIAIKDSTGTSICEFAISGSELRPLDGFQGTYTGSLGEIVLDGANSVKIGGASVAYTLSESNITFVSENTMHVVALDKSAHTYTVVEDGYKGTYTMPDGQSTITLDGFGGAGDGATYVVNGATITIYTSSGSTAYGIDVAKKVFLGKSIFAGLTFKASNFKDNWGDSASFEITFADSSAITGTIYAGGKSYYFDFEGTLSGSELSLTLTRCVSGASDVGKVITATVSGNSITFHNDVSWTYKFTNVVATNASFSF